MVLETCYVIVVRAFYAILPESRVKLELTCRRAGEMNIVSVMGSLSNCARLTFIMRCTLYQIWAPNSLNVNICHVRKMTTAFLNLWLIWIMLNQCGQVLLISLTNLLRSSNSVPAVKLHGLCLFYWVYLVWPLYTLESIERAYSPELICWVVGQA